MLIRVHNLASDPDPTLLNYQKLSSWKVLEIENENEDFQVSRSFNDS